MAPDTVVLITGATQGIGFEVAKALGTRDQQRYTVLLGCRSTPKGFKAADTLKSAGAASVKVIHLDVTDDDSIDAAIAAIGKEYGHLDVLVNNAGIGIDDAVDAQGRHINPNARPHTSLRSLFHETFDVNVYGTAAVTEACVPLLAKAVATPPRIVFVSSHVGSLALRSDPNNDWYTRAHRPSYPVYRSSKAALNMLTLHYAAKFEEQGWKINASCPGLTATDFTGGVGRPAREAAENIVRLVELDNDGPTGTYSDEKGVVPW